MQKAIQLLQQGGKKLALDKGLPTDKQESTESYCPSPDSAGSWQRRRNDQEVQTLAIFS
jgi:hypothetical protein